MLPLDKFARAEERAFCQLLELDAFCESPFELLGAMVELLELPLLITELDEFCESTELDEFSSAAVLLELELQEYKTAEMIRSDSLN